MTKLHTTTSSMRDDLLTSVRVPDSCQSSVKSSGGKHLLAPKLAALAPFVVGEFREPFASSAAMTFFMIRNRRAERFWINDIDPDVTNYHIVVRDAVEQLVALLIAMHGEFGLGSREMFDLARQMVDSDNAVERAAGFYVRNHLSMYGTNGMSGYNPSYVKSGRGIKRHHINRLWQFSAWLQGVRITNLDYREVLDAPGKDVLCYMDPPYSAVGKSMYRFGDADLDELAQRVRASQHSCLVTVDDSPANRVLFSDMSPIQRQYISYVGDDSHDAGELICANYTTPLYPIHARDIGVMLEMPSVAAAVNDDVAAVPKVDHQPAAKVATSALDITMPTPAKMRSPMDRQQQVRHLFIRQGNEQKNCEWYTPDWLLQHLYAANGNQPFDLDPCSPCTGNDAPVWARQHFTLADDGLAQEWHGRVWLNPPYHGLGPWLKKAADAVWCSHMPGAPTEASSKRDKPLCETVVGIIPARTHRRFWRAFVADHAHVFFITGKIGFLKGVDGRGMEVKSRLPEGLAIVVWGNHTPFTDHLRRLPKSIIDIYERSAPTIPDHPVRYWSAIEEAA